MPRKKKIAPHAGNVRTLEELRKLKVKGSDKKSLMIKDISRVLTDLEETKRNAKIIYFSELQGRGVYDSKKKRVGPVSDLAVCGGNVFPEVSHVVVEARPGKLLVPISHVSRFRPWLELDAPFEKIDSRVVSEEDVFLGRNILDKQVVDVNGLKVIRVNDIALTLIKNKLAVVSIDVGSRSILRRLGLHRLAGKLPFFHDHPVPWGSVEPLTRSLEKIHLKVPCARVSDLHPADVADVFEELSMIERKILLKSMKSDKAAKVILECEPDVRTAIIKSLKAKRLASILEKMPYNDAANLLSDFPNVQRDYLLKHMSRQTAERIQEMLSYKGGTVARFMSDTYVTVRQDMTVGETLSFIRDFPKKPENFYYVYVVKEDESLAGAISLKNIIISRPESMLRDVMVPKPVTVDISDPIEYVGDVIAKYDLLALPVVDISGKVRGVINIDDVLDVIVERSRKNEPFELSEQAKSRIRKKKRVKDLYKEIFKDIGQMILELEPTGLAKKSFKKK